MFSEFVELNFGWLVALMISASLFIFIGPEKIWEFIVHLFTTKPGGKKLKGIIYFTVVFPVALILLSGVIKYANAEGASQNAEEFMLNNISVELFLGVDDTFKTSPQCVEKSDEDPWDDTATSNGGLRVTGLDLRLYKVFIWYLHHSCAFNQDSDGIVDSLGLGVQLEPMEGFQIMLSKDYLNDGKEMSSYVIRARLWADKTNTIGFYVQYTQHDYAAREDEYLNYKGLGLSVTYILWR